MGVAVANHYSHHMNNTSVNKWTSTLINNMWEFSLAYTLSEENRKEIQHASNVILEAYEQYNKVQFIIPRQLSSLFTSKKNEQRMKKILT
jgi:hypothetical protein